MVSSHGGAMLTLAGHLDPARGGDPAALIEHGTEALVETALKQHKR